MLGLKLKLQAYPLLASRLRLQAKAASSSCKLKVLAQGSRLKAEGSSCGLKLQANAWAQAQTTRLSLHIYFPAQIASLGLKLPIHAAISS
jgi:hypothetical protein